MRERSIDNNRPESAALPSRNQDFSGSQGQGKLYTQPSQEMTETAEPIIHNIGVLNTETDDETVYIPYH
jgi:hypothetical protein